jgi:hypothetical protein
MFTRLSQDIQTLNSSDDSANSAINLSWIACLLQHLIILLGKFIPNEGTGARKIGKKFVHLLKQIRQDSDVNLLCVLKPEFLVHVKGTFAHVAEAIKFPMDLVAEAETFQSNNEEDSRGRRERIEETLPFDRPIPPLMSKYFNERRLLLTEMAIPQASTAMQEETKIPMENSNSLLGNQYRDEQGQSYARSITDSDKTDVKMMTNLKKKLILTSGTTTSPSTLQHTAPNIEAFSSPHKKHKGEDGLEVNAEYPSCQ